MAEPSPPAAAAAEAAQQILSSSAAEGDSHHLSTHEPTQDMPVPEEEGPAPGESHDDDENDTAATSEDEKAPAARNRPQSALPSDRQLQLAQNENRQLRDEVERMQREIEQLRRGSGAIQDFDDDGAETPPRGGGGGGVGKLGKAIGRKLTRRSSPLYESVSVVESPEKAGAAAVHHRRGGHASASGSGGAADQDVEAGRGASKRVGGTRKAKLSDTEEDDHGRDSFADHDLHPVNIDGSMVASTDQTEVIGNGVDGDIPFRDVVKDRAGWLVGLLVLQSCSSFILARNEALLESHLVIVQFLTMLVGAGGNAGNQASVRVIRGLAVGTLNERTLKPFLWTEAKMGLALSVILGLAGFLRATVFMVPIAETVAITTSLYMIVISSVCIGALLPLAMYRCGLDPAHSSTTIQVLMDILGVTMTVWVSGAILNTSVGPALTAFFHHGAVAAAEAGADDLDAGGAGSSGDDLMEGVE